MPPVNARLVGLALEEAYPALVRTYRGLMEGIGVIKAPQLVVSAEYAAKSPAMAHVGLNKIMLTPAMAELGASPINRGVIGHEMGHILTKKGAGLFDQFLIDSNPLGYYKNYRAMELEMDRIGTMITGSHDDMLAMRKWVKAEGLEPTRASNLINTSSLSGKANRALQRWMEDRGYEIAQGRPSTIVSNIKSVDVNDRGFLNRLVQEYNQAQAKIPGR